MTIAVALAVLSLALYARSVSFDFLNWDDWEYVLLNPRLGRLDLPFLRWAFSSFLVGNWHPLTAISLGIDHVFWGDDALGYHLTNVVLHAANGALVTWLAWLLFRRVAGPGRGSVFGAAVVGAIFVSHPLHVESVAWISERKDVLYAFFWLAATIAWLAYVEAGPDARRRRRAYGLALGLYAMSAMSKPMAVTFPLVLVILDVYPFGRIRDRRDVVRIAVVEKLPFFVVSLVTGVLTLAAQEAGRALGRADLTLLERLLVAERALSFYLVQFLAPVRLVPLYALDPRISVLDGSYWASGAALIVLVVVAVRTRRSAPVVAAGLAFAFVTLGPVLGIIGFGHQSAADRYMYLPLLGPAFIVASGAVWAWRAGVLWRRVTVAASIAALVLLGWRTSAQLPVWRDSVSLWSHVVAAYPDSAIARFNLGHAFVMTGDATRAEAEWRRTLTIDDAYTPALYELGALTGREGRYPEAERFFRAVLQRDPDHELARVNLAMVLDEEGDRDEAAEHYRIFLRLSGDVESEWVEHARARLEEIGEAAGATPSP